MATTPQFCRNGTLGAPKLVTAANTSSQGGGTIGTDIFLVLTADATSGTLVEKVSFVPTATTPTTTTATVGRVFASTQTSGVTTSANTWLLAEVALPAIAADSATLAGNTIDVAINIRLPAGYTLLVTNHAAPAANSAWLVFVVAGDY
jgi:hypothetical protein